MTKETGWYDTLSLVFSAVMISLFAYWTVQGNFFAGVLKTDRSMTWQLIRASGLTAYSLFTLSTLWGLALSSKIVKDWSPGSLSMLLHSTVSWLGIGFAAVHAVLLLFDQYIPYHVAEILVPFTGPYRPLAVGLGTLTFWIMLLVSLSFSVKKQLGHRRWKLLHYTSYAGFFLVTLHAVLAGTDAGRIGLQSLLGLAVLSVVILTGLRIGARKPGKQPART
jgi:sulfoxide reductase heme-binding subunit YedZ